MLDISVNEYLSVINSLKIGDFIVFYFTVYFLISFVQRALGFNIDTNNSIKTNPKILATLVLIQLFYYLHAAIIDRVTFSNDYISLITTGLIFIALVFLFEFILLSNKGLLRYLYKNILYRMAKTTLHHKRNSNNKEMEINHKSVLDHVTHYCSQSKSTSALIVIDLYICIFVYLYIFNFKNN